jgi:hypothetical protein
MMRVVGSYLGAALMSALIAVGLLYWGHIDPSAPRGPLQVPGLVMAWSPDFAIQTRRLGTFLATAGPEVTMPLRLAAALVIFLVLNFVALVLFETTDDAWRGVRLWEAPKPLWATLIFTMMTSSLYMAAVLWDVALLPRLALSPAGFAMAALAGGIVFGLGRPRRAPIED